MSTECLDIKILKVDCYVEIKFVTPNLQRELPFISKKIKNKNKKIYIIFFPPVSQPIS